MSNDYTGPEPTQVIGINVQATAGPRPMQYGIQIHDHESHRGKFQTAIGLNGTSDTAIDLGGHFAVGINTRNNTIRLSEGARIELDQEGKIAIRYRNKRIEFLN